VYDWLHSWIDSDVVLAWKFTGPGKNVRESVTSSESTLFDGIPELM